MEKQLYSFLMSFAVLYTIEFQKQDLPHVHIVLWLKSKYKYPTVEDINSIISAKLSDRLIDPIAYDYIIKFMMHDSCGVDNPRSPCMGKGYYSKKL